MTELMPFQEERYSFREGFTVACVTVFVENVAFTAEAGVVRATGSDANVGAITALARNYQGSGLKSRPGW